MAGKRIGIYAGTFNPIHAGHVAMALQAVESAQLDRLYFLPERQPRYKSGVEHFGHRVAMLARALKPHPKLAVLELPDITFTVQRTLPRLQRLYPDDQLIFIMGSDAAVSIPEWSYADRLLQTIELCIGVRGHENVAVVQQQIANWQVQPTAITIIESYAPEVSSSTIRKALAIGQPVRGLLASVAKYSNRHWLYVSLQRRPDAKLY